jgi:hypothetical protein
MSGNAQLGAFPVAAQAPIAASSLSTGGALTGNLLNDMAAMDAAMAATGQGFAQTAGMGRGGLDQLGPMLKGLQGMGGMQQQQMQGMAAPRITPGRDINVLEPILSLFANQAPNQRPVRRMSLL